MDSTQIDWHLAGNEPFLSSIAEYDIDKAKKLLKTKPHPIVNLPVAQWAAYIDSTPDHYKMWIHKQKLSLKKVDFSIPVIVVEWKNNELLPIDGWHRIAMALRIGRLTLPCVVIPSKEERLIL